MNWKDYRDKILNLIDNEVFYTKELDQLALRHERRGSEIKAQCPFKHLHLAGQDSNPSFTVNLDRGVYFCNSCGSKGNVHTFYTIVKNMTKQDAWLALGDALNLDRPIDEDSRPGIDPGLPSKYHRALMQSTAPIREFLKDRRGLTDETLVRFVIGWDGERVTIPVYDEYNELVNIRRYKWNSYEDNFKMTNFEDEVGNSYGEVRIYGIENLMDDTIDEIIVCEGEWDRLIAEQNGLHACTATAGANNFKYAWFKLFKRKKRINICYDNDEAGQRAASNVIENLKSSVKLKKVLWPDAVDKKCDITDIFVKYKYTVEQFLELFKDISLDDSVPIVQLANSSNAKYTGKRIKIPVLVAGKENAPYIYPKAVKIACDIGNEDNKMCGICLLATKKVVQLSFNASDSALLKLIGCTDEQQRGLLRAIAGVNQKCRCSTMDIQYYSNLETVHMIPKADANFGFSLRQEYVARSGHMIGNNLPTNKRYILSGYVHADPNTQKATYVFDEAIPEKGLLDELEVTPEIFEQLKVFQVAEGQTVGEKFNEIHKDLERNVTYIWDRRKVAFATDLVYHTALNFYFQEQFVKRGWAECLIIGDSGQAKTTIVERIMNHYKCGELLSGESSRRTGLVYNMQPSGSKGQWSLMWGAMPLNDGGLLTIDELSGMSEDDLSKMSDVRSSGIAKATGVITAETTSRTRMIFISNPRNGRQLKAENYGVMSILKLFGKAEDVRRLDFAVAVASGEVDTDIVNKSVSDMPVVEHKYNTDLCRMRVLWAWSRRPENILFLPETTALILEQASKMGRMYSSRVPLVEAADQRLKLARLAVAAAVCVYSTDDGNNVIVKPEHVEFVVEYLNELYTTKAMSYDKLSVDDFENSDTTDGSMARLRKTFLEIPISSRELPDIMKALYQLQYFNRNTLEDATGLDRDDLKNVLHFLIGNSIVDKAGQDYKRTPMGLAFIEHMLCNPANDTELRELRKNSLMGRSEV